MVDDSVGGVRARVVVQDGPFYLYLEVYGECSTGRIGSGSLCGA